jgi:cytochrome c oxidase subunit 1
MLSLDRYWERIFDTGPELRRHLMHFDLFGHPEVRVLVIPAFAFVSEIVPVFRAMIFDIR